MSLIPHLYLLLLLALPDAAVLVEAAETTDRSRAEAPARVSSRAVDSRERPHRRQAQRRAADFETVATLSEPTRRSTEFVVKTLPVSAPHLVRTPPLLC